MAYQTTSYTLKPRFAPFHCDEMLDIAEALSPAEFQVYSTYLMMRTLAEFVGEIPGYVSAITTQRFSDVARRVSLHSNSVSKAVRLFTATGLFEKMDNAAYKIVFFKKIEPTSDNSNGYNADGEHLFRTVLTQIIQYKADHPNPQPDTYVKKADRNDPEIVQNGGHKKAITPTKKQGVPQKSNPTDPQKNKVDPQKNKVADSTNPTNTRDSDAPLKKDKKLRKDQESSSTIDTGSNYNNPRQHQTRIEEICAIFSESYNHDFLIDRWCYEKELEALLLISNESIRKAVVQAKADKVDYASVIPYVAKGVGS